MEQLQNLRNSGNRRSSADLHGKYMGISISQLLAEAKGFGFDVLQQRRERYIIIHMGKILHYKCPNNINIQFCAPSRLGTKAVIPGNSKSSSQRNQTRYDASFAVMGPRLWNIIPSNLHSIDSLLRFKTNLKAFLKTFPDEPLVPGYTCRNGNSLLEWNENKAASLLQRRSNSSMTL